jgi:spore maturation protein CgeB
MRIVLFCHSLLSDWNHGNAHFLRGVVSELVSMGHAVRVYEPEDAWSLENLVRDHGRALLSLVHEVYPAVRPTQYRRDALDLDEALEGADLVLVHEWNDPELVANVGRVRARGGSFRLLFHDTHHRGITAPEELARFDLSAYDGVLAFGEVLRELYLRRGWASRAFIWHEAADTRLFRPLEGQRKIAELCWVGNWGDDERTEELSAFLLRPVKRLRLSATVHGVRYPDGALRALADANIEYRGFAPNFEVPKIFAQHRVTVHVPRRPYVKALPGIPTIRPFEAMACGIPLVSAPWLDVEGLFRAGRDYLVANDEDEMTAHLRALLSEPAMAAELSLSGRRTVVSRHTCRHRAEELLQIAESLGTTRAPAVTQPIPHPMAVLP